MVANVLPFTSVCVSVDFLLVFMVPVVCMYVSCVDWGIAVMFCKIFWYGYYLICKSCSFAIIPKTFTKKIPLPLVPCIHIQNLQSNIISYSVAVAAYAYVYVHPNSQSYLLNGFAHWDNHLLRRHPFSLSDCAPSAVRTPLAEYNKHDHNWLSLRIR